MDMKEYGLYESASVKIQILKTAIEVRVIRFWRKCLTLSPRFLRRPVCFFGWMTLFKP